jgi:hypothetical protein
MSIRRTGSLTTLTGRVSEDKLHKTLRGHRWRDFSSLGWLFPLLYPFPSCNFRFLLNDPAGPTYLFCNELCNHLPSPIRCCRCWPACPCGISVCYLPPFCFWDIKLLDGWPGHISSSVVACEPTVFTWDGGKGLYFQYCCHAQAPGVNHLFTIAPYFLVRIIVSIVLCVANAIYILLCSQRCVQNDGCIQLLLIQMTGSSRCMVTRQLSNTLASKLTLHIHGESTLF